MNDTTRRWVTRADVLTRRSVDRASRLGGLARRNTRRIIGRTELPPTVWRRSAPPVFDTSGASPLPRTLMPLPASAALARAVTGEPIPSLDAWHPLPPPAATGDAAAASSTVLLLIVEAEPAPGAWTPAEAAAVVATRHRAAPSAALHTVARVEPAVRADFRHALRHAAGRRVPGLLTVTADVAALGAVLPLAHAVLVPDQDAAPTNLLDPAAAAGRAVLGPGWVAERRDRLVDAGRRARLDLARRTPGLSPGTAAGRPEAPARVEVGAEPRRVVVAGHDLKFAGGLIAELRGRGHEVRLDEWRGHARHDVEASRALAAWADVVHCEWSLGNAVWHSRHVQPGVRLTVRTHLQEAATVFPARVRADRVDAWVFVAEHVRAQVVRDASLDPSCTRWVPNAVALPDDADAVLAEALARPDRRRLLGLVGVLPERKGLARALDVLALLRARDDRYRLRIRGHRPEDVPWMARRPGGLSRYEAQDRRMAEEPALAGAVVWDPHGPDMGRWYAGVGTVLSASDFESFHFTLPDGAVHGCLPRSLAWAGADLLYPADWLAPSTAELADAVWEGTRDAGAWAAGVESAAVHVRDCYSASVVVPRLADVVLGLG